MPLWVIVTLAVLLGVIIAVCSAPIRFYVKVRKRGSDDRIEFKVSWLFGLIRFHNVMPLLSFEGLGEGLRIKMEETGTMPGMKNASKDEEGRIDKAVLDKWSAEFKEALKGTKGLRQWGIQTAAQVRIHRLDWSTDFSLGDAATTATAAGAIWGLKCTAVGLGSQWIKLMKTPRLFVVPVFEDRLLYSTELECDGSYPAVKALLAGFRLVIRVLREREGIRHWKSLIALGMKPKPKVKPKRAH